MFRLSIQSGINLQNVRRCFGQRNAAGPNSWRAIFAQCGLRALPARVNIPVGCAAILRPVARK